MSWSLDLPQTTKEAAIDDLLSAVSAAADADLQNGIARPQAQHAARVAGQLIATTDHLGTDPTSAYSVSISGHVHEGQGSAADALTITVQRSTLEPQSIDAANGPPESTATNAKRQKPEA